VDDIRVPHTTQMITLQTSAADPLAEISMNEYPTTTRNVSLNYGTNTATILVTSPNGLNTVETTVRILREDPPNVFLSSLSSSSADIQPSFLKTNANYEISVPYETSITKLAALAEDPTAKVTIEGVTGPNGEIPLAIGQNSFKVTVTSQDGTTSQTYTMSVFRAPPEFGPLILAEQFPNEVGVETIPTTDLANINVSPGSLSPTFNPETTLYTVEVDENTNFMAISVNTIDPTATVSIQGIEGTSSEVKLVGETTRIEVKVFATDGSVKSYIVEVKKKTSPTSPDTVNVQLKNIVLKGATLQERLDPANATIKVVIPKGAKSFHLTAIPVDSRAIVMINGKLVAASQLTFSPSHKKHYISIASPDGTKVMQYTLIVEEGLPNTGERNQDWYFQLGIAMIVSGLGVLIIVYRNHISRFIS
jgi:LPXTG-motif cell wall-anchored protein